jgi:hypothetical protein
LKFEIQKQKMFYEAPAAQKVENKKDQFFFCSAK